MKISVNTEVLGTKAGLLIDSIAGTGVRDYGTGDTMKIIDEYIRHTGKIVDDENKVIFTDRRNITKVEYLHNVIAVDVPDYAESELLDKLSPLLRRLDHKRLHDLQDLIIDMLPKCALTKLINAADEMYCEAEATTEYRVCLTRYTHQEMMRLSGLPGFYTTDIDDVYCVPMVIAEMDNGERLVVNSTMSPTMMPAELSSDDDGMPTLYCDATSYHHALILYKDLKKMLDCGDVDGIRAMFQDPSAYDEELTRDEAEDTPEEEEYDDETPAVPASEDTANYPVVESDHDAVCADDDEDDEE